MYDIKSEQFLEELKKVLNNRKFNTININVSVFEIISVLDKLKEKYKNKEKQIKEY